MAARAHLKVKEDVRKAFVDASSAKKRCLIVKIEEELLVLADVLDVKGNEATDFDELAFKMGEDESAFLLFQLDSGKWLFVAYIPDTAKVRDKMLYASSIDDLQDQLGKGLFVSFYKCSDKPELSYRSWKSSTRRSSLDKIMTDKEKVIREEQLMERSSCASGMKAVAFAMRDTVRNALKDLANGTRNIVLIRMDTKGGREECDLQDVNGDAVVDDLVDVLKKQPRFLVMKEKTVTSSGDGAVFALFCPENAKAMHKMIYATAKKAVEGHVKDVLGSMKIVANVEISDVSELRMSVKRSIDASNTSMEQTHKMAFKKPSRARGKRRGRRGLIKKPV